MTELAERGVELRTLGDRRWLSRAGLALPLVESGAMRQRVCNGDVSRGNGGGGWCGRRNKNRKAAITIK